MSSVKNLFLGIVLIILVAIGGLVYRNAVERSNQPIACPLSAKVCPDGTSLAAEGMSCNFPVCPPPNVSIDTLGIAYAVPEGYTPFSEGTAAEYQRGYTKSGVSSTTEASSITIRRYPITASSTALATIQATAIGGASGVPVPATAYSSTSIKNRQFTVVLLERFEGTVHTAYYLARDKDVLRFDAIDSGGFDWTSSDLDVSLLPAHAALRQLLATLQGE